MSIPQYGEMAPPAPPAPVENKTKNVYEAETNENDVNVAKEMTKRSRIRAIGTVGVFALLMSPFIITVLRMVPQ